MPAPPIRRSAPAFSRALIGYAKERVEGLTARLRDDRVAGAADGFAEAEARMIEAQERIVDLQERLGVVSAEDEVANGYVQIGAIEVELRDARARGSRAAGPLSLDPGAAHAARRGHASACGGEHRAGRADPRGRLPDGVADRCDPARAGLGTGQVLGIAPRGR